MDCASFATGLAIGLKKGGGNAKLTTKSITENGSYSASDDNADGYSSVEVNVQPDLSTKTITENGIYRAVDDELDGYNVVIVNIAMLDADAIADMIQDIIDNITPDTPPEDIADDLQGIIDEITGENPPILPADVGNIDDDFGSYSYSWSFAGKIPMYSWQMDTYTIVAVNNETGETRTATATIREGKDVSQYIIASGNTLTYPDWYIKPYGEIVVRSNSIPLNF